MLPRTTPQHEDAPISLADYIEQNIEHLQAEWTAFAGTRQPAASYVPVEALTNGSKELLLGIAADLRTEQSHEQRQAKSRGAGDEGHNDLVENARQHAGQRLKDGFTLDQLVSEYRALRASVVREWPETLRNIDDACLDELVRFNEAMDQSLCAAVRAFNAGTEQAQDIFIGILSHDFRSPLGAAVNGNHLQRLCRENTERFEEANDRVSRSLTRMTHMINDLLDFSRTRMGRPLPLKRRESNLETICRETVDLVSSVNPGCNIRLEFNGHLEGEWDPERVAQLLTNLLGNAIRHGDRNRPVTVAARGDAGSASVSVHNHGEPIPLDRQYIIFDPLRSGVVTGDGAGAHRESLGLGLYIARSIAEAHGGRMSVTSSEGEGTTFTASLPKTPAP
jgi:signal transduction histidine kinase